jgi:flavorubredoxin
MPAVAATLTYMKGLRPKNRVGGAFGSYGWSGEAPKIVHEWLASMDMEMPAPFVKTPWAPRHESLGQCHELGKAVGQALIVKCGD